MGNAAYAGKREGWRLGREDFVSSYANSHISAAYVSNYLHIYGGRWMASAIFIGDNRGFFLHHVRGVLLFFWNSCKVFTELNG